MPQSALHTSPEEAADTGSRTGTLPADRSRGPERSRSSQRRRWRSYSLLLEGLVLAEIRDHKAERVDRNHRVRDVVPHRENEVADVLFALRFGVVGRGVVDFFEIDRGPVRGLPQVLDRDVLDVDLNLFGGAGQELLDGLAFLVGFDDRAGYFSI